MGEIDRLLEQRYNEGVSEGIRQGIVEGISQGISHIISHAISQAISQAFDQGIDQGARQLAMGLLSKKFGTVPPNISERVQAAHTGWCRQLTEQILTARTPDELDLS